MVLKAHKLGLGHVTWWSLPDQISLDRSQWAARYPNFPLEPEPYADALKRALFSIQPPKDGTRMKRLVRPLKAKDRWALVFEVPGEDNLRYHVEMAVELHDAYLAVVRYPTQYASLARDVEDAYQAERYRVTSNAVANMILRHIRGECLAVVARKTGGVYFIPQMFEDRLEAVQALVEQLGGTMMAFRVDDDERGRKGLVTLIIEDLKGAVEAARANIEARHKNDALLMAKQALDRVNFYRDGMMLATEHAEILKTELEQLIVDSALKNGEKND